MAHAVYKEVLRFWKVAFQTIAAPVLNLGAVHDDFWPCARRPCEGLRRRALHRVFVARPHHDERLAKCLCQQLVQLGAKQDHGQFGLLAAYALVALALVHVAYVGSSMLRGLAVGFGVFAVTVWFAPLAIPSASCGFWYLPSCVRRFVGRIGIGRWSYGQKNLTKWQPSKVLSSCP